MSNVSEPDIANLLQRWHADKAQIAASEQRIEKYKRLANKILNNIGKDTVSSANYALRRSQISRTTIAKRDVPVQVWEKYARSCTYPAYYLTEK